MNFTSTTKTLFASRRRRLLETMGPDMIAIFASTPTSIRNNDVEHEFRQDSDLYYLTGFNEPNAVVVLGAKAHVMVEAESSTPAHEQSETQTKKKEAKASPYTMFVRPKDKEREVWDGYRAGVEGAKNDFGADFAFETRELSQRLPELFLNHNAILYRLGNHEIDEKVLQAIQQARRLGNRKYCKAPTRIVDPIEILHEHRVRKEEHELDAMRKASAITSEAHIEVMKQVKPGCYEYELESILLEIFRKHGSDRPAYGSIVASGINATILHYRSNNRRIEDGDLVLIDAGCEYDYYASDVTRTFPANGRFTETQRAVYQAVLEAQIACIEMVKPGVTQEQIHDLAVRSLTTSLLRLGVVNGELENLIKDKAYEPYYMHKTGHWLGMDVHDVGAYLVQAPPNADKEMQSRPLEPGMVITIEPGLYFGTYAKDSPEAFRGIGVRIEDDILVTEHGHEVLTSSIPKQIAEIEAICASSFNRS